MYISRILESHSGTGATRAENAGALCGTHGTQTGTPDTQEPNERDKDESLKKTAGIIAPESTNKTKEIGE